MNKNITELFCFVDDFCKAVDKNFAEKLLPNGRKPARTPKIIAYFIIVRIDHKKAESKA